MTPSPMSPTCLRTTQPWSTDHRHIRITHTIILVGTQEWDWQSELESPGARIGAVTGAIAIGTAAT